MLQIQLINLSTLNFYAYSMLIVCESSHGLLKKIINYKFICYKLDY